MANVGDAGSIVSASCAADAGLSNTGRADGRDAVIARCPVKVTVGIKLNPPVACPGHPLPITAVGEPSGGAYSWTVSGAELVDDSGSPLYSGDTVYLRAFQADDNTGNIPEKKATVGVTYTHPNGTAQDSKPVKIHKIDFAVTNTQLRSDHLEAKEDQVMVRLENRDPDVPTINIDPNVTIHLDASCPRKADCASNHRAGWIQDVTRLNKSVKWRHRTIAASLTVGPPVRDSLGEAEFPFYADPIPFRLEIDADSDTETVNHSDSPGWGALWRDPKAPDEAADNSLDQVVFQQSFTAWLVVQNVEWSQHDMKGSFAFQKHFDWSVNHTVKVDTIQRVGGRCTPPYSRPEISDLGNGRGAASQSLTTKNALDATTMRTITADPPARHPSLLKHHK